MLLWLTSVAFADCPAPTTTSEVVDHAEQGTLAYADLDEETFRAEVLAAGEAVSCLSERMMPEDAASLHRATALVSFADDDADSAVASFRAALRLQPNYKLPSSLAAPGGPVATLYETALAIDAADMYLVPDPDEGEVYVDGHRTRDAPQGLPAVLQVVRPDGMVHWSGVVWAPQQLPEWFTTNDVPAVVPMPQPEILDLEPLPEPMPLPQQTASSGPGKALWIGAAVAAVGAGGFFAGAAASRSGYEQEPTAAARQATNGLYFGSVGLGVATLGLGAAAVATSGGSR